MKDDLRAATGSVSATDGTNTAYDDSTGVTDTVEVTDSVSATDGTDSLNVAGPAGSPGATDIVSVAVIIIASLFAVRGSDILFVFLVLVLCGVFGFLCLGTKNRQEHGLYVVSAGELLVVAAGQVEIAVAVVIQIVLVNFVLQVITAPDKRDSAVFLLVFIPVLLAISAGIIYLRHVTMPLIILAAGGGIAAVLIIITEYKMKRRYRGI
ncbi:MAG: hypothetical protein U9N40_03725 [Euryarchaeota archaeon]|nr:hypothetical protein [Euryarchaeota archaeon]